MTGTVVVHCWRQFKNLQVEPLAIVVSMTRLLETNVFNNAVIDLTMIIRPTP